LLCGFHDETTPPVTAAPVANLLDEAARTRAEEPATRETARALVRKRRLDELAGAEEATWAHVEQMIGTANPTCTTTPSDS
jgi:hypothetical protein